MSCTSFAFAYSPFFPISLSRQSLGSVLADWNAMTQEQAELQHGSSTGSLPGLVEAGPQPMEVEGADQGAATPWYDLLCLHDHFLDNQHVRIPCRRRTCGGSAAREVHGGCNWWGGAASGLPAPPDGKRAASCPDGCPGGSQRAVGPSWLVQVA